MLVCLTHLWFTPQADKPVVYALFLSNYQTLPPNPFVAEDQAYLESNDSIDLRILHPGSPMDGLAQIDEQPTWLERIRELPVIRWFAGVKHSSQIVYLCGHGSVDSEGHPGFVIETNDREANWLTIESVLEALKQQPLSDFVVLIDGSKYLDQWELGFAEHDFANQLNVLLSRLDEANQIAANITVVNACSGGETNRPLVDEQATLFMSAVTHGLAGAADGFGRVNQPNDPGVTDGVVMRDELVNYLQATVRRLALANFGDNQTPFAVVKGNDHSLARRVANRRFFARYQPSNPFVAEGDNPSSVTATDGSRPFAKDSTAIEDHWRWYIKSKQDAEKQFAAFRTSPNLWARFESELLKLDRLVLAGEKYQPQLVAKLQSLDVLRSQLERSHFPGDRLQSHEFSSLASLRRFRPVEPDELEVASNVYRKWLDALEPQTPSAGIETESSDSEIDKARGSVAAGADPSTSDTQPEAPSRHALAEAVWMSLLASAEKQNEITQSELSQAIGFLDQAGAEAAVANARAANAEFVEIHLLRLLLREIDWKTSDSIPSELLTSFDASEFCANVRDPRAFYFLRSMVDDRDSFRRRIEDHVFVDTNLDRESADSLRYNLRAEALRNLDHYREALVTAEKIADAFALRDLLLSELEHLVRWTTACDRVTSSDNQDRQQTEIANATMTLIAALKQLTIELNLATVADLDTDGLRDRVARIDATGTQLSDLRKQLLDDFRTVANELAYVSGGKRSDDSRLREMLPFPFLLAEERTILVRRLQQPSGQAADFESVVVDAQSPSPIASHSSVADLFWASAANYFEPQRWQLNDQPVFSAAAATPLSRYAVAASRRLAAKQSAASRTQTSEASSILAVESAARVSASPLMFVGRTNTTVDEAADSVCLNVQRQSLADQFLWFAMRSLYDFWGPATSGDEPFFVLSTQRSIDSAGRLLAEAKPTQLDQQGLADARSLLRLRRQIGQIGYRATAEPLFVARDDSQLHHHLDWTRPELAWVDAPPSWQGTFRAGKPPAGRLRRPEAGDYDLPAPVSPSDAPIADAKAFQAFAPAKQVPLPSVGLAMIRFIDPVTGALVGHSLLDGRRTLGSLHPIAGDGLDVRFDEAQLPPDQRSLQVRTSYRGHDWKTSFTVNREQVNHESLVRRTHTSRPQVTVTTDTPPVGELMIVLDCSASMSAAMGSGGQTRLDVATKAISKLLKQIPDRTMRINLTLFGHRAGWIQDETVPRGESVLRRDGVDESVTPNNDAQVALKTWPLIDDSLRQEISDLLAGQQPTGQTPLYFAIDEAIAEFSRSGEGGPRHLIVVTDGVNQQPSEDGDDAAIRTAADIHEVFDSLQHFIKLDIIGLDFARTRQEQPQQVSELEQLAKLGKGKLYQPGGDRELVASLSQSIGELRYSVSSTNSTEPESSKTLGSTWTSTAASSSQKIDVKVYSASETLARYSLELHDGQLIRLFYDRNTKKLSPVASASAAIAGRQLPFVGPPRLLKSPATGGGTPHRLRVLRPVSEGGRMVFYVAIENVDDPLATRPPRQVWAQIRPQPNLNVDEPIVFQFSEVDLVGGTPMPVLRFIADGWPVYAKSATINLAFTDTIDELDLPLSIGAGNLITFDTGVQITSEMKDERTLIVREYHSDSKTLLSTLLEVTPAPDQSAHRYLGRHNRVVHEYRYTEPPKTIPFINITNQDEFRRRSYTLSGAMGVVLGN